MCRYKALGAIPAMPEKEMGRGELADNCDQRLANA